MLTERVMRMSRLVMHGMQRPRERELSSAAGEKSYRWVGKEEPMERYTKGTGDFSRLDRGPASDECRQGEIGE